MEKYLLICKWVIRKAFVKKYVQKYFEEKWKRRDDDWRKEKGKNN